MGLVVQKYGGSSVRDAERVMNVAKRITDTYKQGNNVVVAVSAQGDTTDDLIAKANEINPNASKREMDMLLATGEQISIALLAMAIEKLGFPVISLTGWQAEVKTDTRYGAARIAFRLSAIRENGIYFNQCFGGGTQHCAGEDNLFLNACINKGLRIYAYPAYIAELTEERLSTWDTGDTKKYLKDKGALFRALSPRFWFLLCLQDAIRHSSKYNMKSVDAFRLMLNSK